MFCIRKVGTEQLYKRIKEEDEESVTHGYGKKLDKRNTSKNWKKGATKRQFGKGEMRKQLKK